MLRVHGKLWGYCAPADHESLIGTLLRWGNEKLLQASLAILGIGAEVGQVGPGSGQPVERARRPRDRHARRAAPRGAPQPLPQGRERTTAGVAQHQSETAERSGWEIGNTLAVGQAGQSHRRVEVVEDREGSSAIEQQLGRGGRVGTIGGGDAGIGVGEFGARAGRGRSPNRRRGPTPPPALRTGLGSSRSRARPVRRTPRDGRARQGRGTILATGWRGHFPNSTRS